MPKIKLFKKEKPTASAYFETKDDGTTVEGVSERKNKRHWSSTSKEVSPSGTTIETSEKRSGRNIEKSRTVSGPEMATSYLIKEKVPRKPLFGILGLAKKKKKEND